MPTDRLPDVRAARLAAEDARLRVPALRVALVIEGLLLAQVCYAVLLGPEHGFRVDLGVILIAALLGLVLWVRWFRAVYRGVTALGLARYPMIWAALGWFVPVATLFVPKQMVNDLWPGKARPLAVELWWLCWVVAGVLFAVPGDSDVAVLGGGIGAGVTLLGTPFAVLTAAAVTGRLEELVAAVMPAPAPAPEPAPAA